MGAGRGAGAICTMSKGDLVSGEWKQQEAGRSAARCCHGRRAIHGRGAVGESRWWKALSCRASNWPVSATQWDGVSVDVWAVARKELIENVKRRAGDRGIEAEKRGCWEPLRNRHRATQ